MDIISKKVLSQLVITNMSHCAEVLGQTMPRECTTFVSPSTPTSVSTLLSTVIKAHRALALCTHHTVSGGGASCEGRCSLKQRDCSLWLVPCRLGKWILLSSEFGPQTENVLGQIWL